MLKALDSRCEWSKSDWFLPAATLADDAHGEVGQPLVSDDDEPEMGELFLEEDEIDVSVIAWLRQLFGKTNEQKKRHLLFEKQRIWSPGIDCFYRGPGVLHSTAYARIPFFSATSKLLWPGWSGVLRLAVKGPCLLTFL